MKTNSVTYCTGKQLPVSFLHAPSATFLQEPLTNKKLTFVMKEVMR